MGTPLTNLWRATDYSGYLLHWEKPVEHKHFATHLKVKWQKLLPKDEILKLLFVKQEKAVALLLLFPALIFLWKKESILQADNCCWVAKGFFFLRGFCLSCCFCFVVCLFVCFLQLHWYIKLLFHSHFLTWFFWAEVSLLP